ncbi:hypothetical protein CRI94_11765 [Longibacter salinarum]|uniref:Metal-binding protein n=1 Tax=Longibacter salinarum TaxID=1850348 RepID=A0A2A8CY47_9BACT|nr:DUF2182 domain-containing protein [Longibacter salinarum]PEN13308.1 hypothetical protein CRI94_11765 [Longibacter salinarum]
MSPPLTQTSVFQRDRLLILAGLFVLAILAWAYMAEMASHMSMASSTSPRQAWNAEAFGVAFGMWSVMMMGMMLPSASPMVLTFYGISRRRTDGHEMWGTALFVLGYVLVWVGYSAGAALLQGGLHAVALLTPMGASANPYFAGGLLVMAGLYQFTPLKDACMTGCRSPMGFIMAEWRPGHCGALVMGWRHGLNCAGCCWATMALMFVLGVMNLLWMAALTALCLIEKIAPGGDRFGRLAGVGFIGWGAWLVGRALL